MKKVFLYAYDRQNLGDDLFVHTITRRYPHVQFYMWSDRKNREVFSCLPNLKVIDKDSRFLRLLHTLRPSLVVRYRARLEQRCDAVVYIGGSIFMETPYWESLCTWWEYEAANRPFYVLGANFGPWHSEAYHCKMTEIFNACQDVCFRDRHSAGLFPGIKTVRHSPELLFSYPMPKVPVKRKQLFVSLIDCATKTEGASPLAEFESRYLSNMCQLLASYLASGWHIILSAFCEAEGDLGVVKKIYQALSLSESNDQVSILSYDGTNSAELLAELAASEYVIASRFHAAILALRADRPVFPVIYSEKTSRVLEEISFPGTWADLRTAENISYEASLRNLHIKFDAADLSLRAQAHFAALDKHLNS